MSTVVHIDIAGYPGLHACPEAPDQPVRCLFLHGAWGNAQQFAGWARLFATWDLEAYTVSRRGREGVPPAGARGVNFSDYIEDTVRVIDRLGRDIIVIGHSLGGTLALKLAEMGLCTAAVLLAPGASRSESRHRPPLVAMLPFLSIVGSMALGRPFLPSRHVAERLFLGHVPEPDRGQAYAALVPESGRASRQALFSSIDRSRVRCPVLCIAPGQDASIRAATYHAIATRYGAELHEYPGHGHWLIAEPGWEAIARDVATWIKGLERSKLGD